jgi:hypothetical protein
LQEAKTVSCLYCKKRIKLETEERLQHRQTNKVQDGVLTSLSKGEELSEGSVPCDSGSKTDSTEVNSVRSEDSPSKSLIEMQKVTFDNYNYLQVPKDVLEYTKRLKGICGEASIASLFECNVKDVFMVWGIGESNFKGWTLQKEMKFIINKFGYDAKQRVIKDKYKLPDADFAIIRVSFGEPNQHWSKTAKESHYLAIKRFKQGWYIYDNSIGEFDGKPINGIWIEKSEYYKWMEANKMFVTSYIEITGTQCGNCGLKHFPETKCSIQPSEGEWYWKKLNEVTGRASSQQ